MDSSIGTHQCINLIQSAVDIGGPDLCAERRHPPDTDTTRTVAGGSYHLRMSLRRDSVYRALHDASTEPAHVLK